MNSKLTFRLVLATSIFCGTVALQIEPLAQSQEPESAVMDPLVDEKLASVLKALQGLSIGPELRHGCRPRCQISSCIIWKKQSFIAQANLFGHNTIQIRSNSSYSS
jgi:hypothetical protein